jgi:hypothetical protein
MTFLAFDGLSVESRRQTSVLERSEKVLRELRDECDRDRRSPGVSRAAHAPPTRRARPQSTTSRRPPQLASGRSFR